jgi:hypothetical protein
MASNYTFVVVYQGCCSVTASVVSTRTISFRIARLMSVLHGHPGFLRAGWCSHLFLLHATVGRPTVLVSYVGRTVGSCVTDVCYFLIL